MKNTCQIFYRIPKGQDIHFIQGEQEPLNLEKANNHFLIAPFLFPTEEGIMVDMSSANKLSIEELSQGGYEPFHLAKPKENDQPNYIQMVKDAKAEIEQGKYSKVVLSRTKEISFQSHKIIEQFAALCEKYPNAFVHLSSSSLGTWVGATPELLFSKKEKMGRTVSLAGTKKKEKEGWGEKEIEEQDIVTRFIIDHLKREVNEIEISQQSTSQIGPIAHIKKEINFRHDGHPKSIIEILHPTPAVCGMPKAESRVSILKHEGYDRELYTGFIGPMESNNSCSLFVNLRCMQFFENKAHLYIGAGITKDSIAEDELEETENKSKVLLSVLGS